MKDELDGKMMNTIIAPQMEGYLTIDECVDKKAKTTKNCVIKWEIKFQDYKKFLEKNKTILKSQQRFRGDAHSVFIENVNRIALIAKYDKRIQNPDEVATYPYGYEH